MIRIAFAFVLVLLVRYAGKALLLLHSYPQTRVMWRSLSTVLFATDYRK